MGFGNDKSERQQTEAFDVREMTHHSALFEIQRCLPKTLLPVRSAYLKENI